MPDFRLKGVDDVAAVVVFIVVVVLENPSRGRRFLLCQKSLRCAIGFNCKTTIFVFNC